MPNASRSFCQLDLASLLGETASERWGQVLREHALDCPGCALRIGAIDRLNARLNAPLSQPSAGVGWGAVVSARRPQPGRFARLVRAPARRMAALAAMGVVATVLALAAGHGLPRLAQMVNSGLGDGFVTTSRSRAVAWNGEEQARQLASNGSPTPLPLALPAFPPE